MRVLVFILFVYLIFLSFKVFTLESELAQTQKNTAIAVLSAEAANNKIGAFAPYFSEDKEHFINAWFDYNNMPLAVFPDNIISPIKSQLIEKRQSEDAKRLKALIFK